MIRIRNCARSDRNFLVRLVAQDSDPIPGFVGVTADDIARGTRRIFGFPVWWVLTLTRWLRVPLARLIVAEYDGIPVGFVSAAYQRRHVVIGSLLADQSFRRKGIGSSLMEAAEASARTRGARLAVLEVNRANEGARRLYDRRGYRVLFLNHWLERVLADRNVPDHPSPRIARNAAGGDLRRVRSLRLKTLPAPVLEVLPAPNEDPASIDQYAKGKHGEFRSWCIGEPGAPTGLVRAYTSAEGGLSFLSCPYLDASKGEEEQEVLIGTAIDWLRSKKATRVVSAVPSYSSRALAALGALGFVERMQSEFRVRDLA